jgi:nucleoside-diphosphate-sugar epimerase
VTVALLGGAGFIGRAVSEVLLARGTPFFVIDQQAHQAGELRLDLAAADARDALARAFEGKRAVIHLASRVDPANPKEREATRRLHVDGTLAVAEAARAAGVERLVLASSATVYGAWPDNAVPLDEDRPTRPNPGFFYAQDKLVQEQIVERSGVSWAIARPAIVYGPGARNYLTEILRRSPVLPALNNKRPPLQFVHVADVARALALLADAPASALGPRPIFNVAPTDWMAFDDVARVARRRVVPVPLAATRGFDVLARLLPPHLRAPRAMLPYLMEPFVIDSARMRALGWHPRARTEDALRSIV